MKDPIPTISLSSTKTGEDHASLVRSVRMACIETGFFYVSDHGMEMQPALFEQSRLFFGLPPHEKRSLFDATLARGYTPMGEETLDPANQSVGDTKEGFYASANDVSSTDPNYNPDKLMGPNQWPDSERCPSLHDPTVFQSVVNTYIENIMHISRTVVALIAESLGLEPHHFDEDFCEPQALLGLLHYAAVPSNLSTGVFACGAHSDYGMITLLLTDDSPGLQIYREDRWVDIPPRPDCFICNLGDMLERWTNGLYRSTLHRVVNTTGAERYSVPFFFEPNFDAVVACLPTCCSDTNPPRYPPTTSGEHLVAKYRETHADFKPNKDVDAGNTT